MVNSNDKIVSLKGGLGNQLFQYSFAKFLQKNFELNIKLDISWFESQSLRKFELNSFLENNELQIITKKPSFFENVISYRSEKILSRLLKNNYLPPVKYFNGYWQDIYFANYLKFENNLNKKISKKNINKDYYIIHLRKGDFLNSKVHYDLPNSYYKSSVELFTDKQIIVLSPSKYEALEFIKDANINGSFVDTNEEEAFSLILNASGGIASNSTFCWWAVYFSNCKNWILPFHWLKNINIFEHKLNINKTIIL